MDLLKSIIAVAGREVRIWARRPIYLMGSVVVMLFCTVFYLSFLKEGVPSDVPIGVVDLDGSSTSRLFVQQLDATQIGKVVRYDSFAEARRDMQSGKITSVCVLPEGFNRDIQSFRQPTISYYINGLYLLGGSLAWKDLLLMSNLSSGAVQREILRKKGVPESRIEGMLRPIDVDVHQIGNATMNYGAYLANMMLPGMLQMVIVILTIYAFGTELKYGTSRHLLEISGGIGRAILGKLSLYTLLFTAIGFSLEVILYRWMHFPMAGHFGSMLLGIFLMVLASECVGIFIIGCVPVCRFALSIGSLYSVLALSLTGFTLPAEAIPGPVAIFTWVFPLRHYYMFYVQEGIFASGFAGWYPYAVGMLCFLFMPYLVLRRLKHAYIYQDYNRN
ncbi:MAG: ABC transporter permease [Bacteroidales bacterium]|nr:ABC transporter permease [Bacteroidales bacterium]